jgi:hypothetical protein
LKTISSRGLTDKDQLVLKSLIDLVITRTRHNWSYTDNTESDVAIVDTDNLSNLSSILNDLRAHRILAVEYSSREASSGVTPFRIPKPLRAANLISTINAVEASLESDETGPEQDSSAPPAQQSQARETLKTDTTASELLSGTGAQWLRITSGELYGVVELIGDRYQISPGSTLDELLAQPDRQVQGVAAPDTSDPSAWHKTRSLRWKLGHYLSDGQLLNTLHGSSRFKLLRWPPSDVPRLAPHIMTLCALLGRKSGATLDEIVAESGIPKTDAIAFINGAYMAKALSVRAFNHAEKANPEAATEEPPPKGLFDKIRDRLKRKL